ncbi:GNAT family N-acetyltransferase [Streptomyces tropicalis]|uniref:GNAT family N-acetyltransferase n=1 Tax=Streptomyces tropicalis TaxID=3034234 RepID=A0ABT6A5T2_9ACTN|nr:GNAT family N-acetyltransferase [Streptomyces tropicalis]MDF3299995.1 GNAT family N-acetyltransferase [Streptomyces tropicalis]
MIRSSPVPPVVPAGRMARAEQPVLDLPGGLELRPWHPGDAGVLVAAARDPAIAHWNRLHVGSPEEGRKRIERMHERWRGERSAIWAMARPGGGEALGLIGWGDIDLHNGDAEIVYWVTAAARGAGVAVEATRRVVRWALDDLGLHRLRLCHAVENEASCRVAVKAGFSYEGTLRSALLHGDGWHDEHLHALVEGDPADTAAGDAGASGPV